LGSSQVSVTEVPWSFSVTCPGGSPVPTYGLKLCESDGLGDDVALVGELAGELAADGGWLAAGEGAGPERWYAGTPGAAMRASPKEATRATPPPWPRVRGPSIASTGAPGQVASTNPYSGGGSVGDWRMKTPGSVADGA